MIFSLSFTRSVSHGYDFVHIWPIPREYSFHKKFYKIQNMCMLNMFTFHVLSVCHSLGQSVTDMNFPSRSSPSWSSSLLTLSLLAFKIKFLYFNFEFRQSYDINKKIININYRWPQILLLYFGITSSNTSVRKEGHLRQRLSYSKQSVLLQAPGRDLWHWKTWSRWRRSSVARFPVRTASRYTYIHT